MNHPKQNGPNREVNCPVDLDILERIKREANHKRIPHKVLLNKILREAVFKDKRSKKEERLLQNPFCPQCNFDLLKGKVENSADEESDLRSEKSWRNLWGLLPS